MNGSHHRCLYHLWKFCGVIQHGSCKKHKQNFYKFRRLERNACHGKGKIGPITFSAQYRHRHKQSNSGNGIHNSQPVQEMQLMNKKRNNKRNRRGSHRNLKLPHSLVRVQPV